MAIGKNKRVSKGKGKAKKKVVDPMSRKEWYDVVAPAIFANRQFCKTIGNKTIGDKLGANNFANRVFQTTLADLTGSTTKDEPFRKVKFIVKDVQGRNLLTQFYGMDLTADRTRSLLRKWCTTIEGDVVARTADGYELRLFLLAFTRRQQKQTSKNCYAKSRLVKWVRLRMTRIIQRMFKRLELNKVVALLAQDTVSDVLFKRCNPIVPLRDVKIRKVKLIKAPKFDAQKFLDGHGVVPSSSEGLVATSAAAVVETAA